MSHTGPPQQAVPAIDACKERQEILFNAYTWDPLFYWADIAPIFDVEVRRQTMRSDLYEIVGDYALQMKHWNACVTANCLAATNSPQMEGES